MTRARSARSGTLAFPELFPPEEGRQHEVFRPIHYLGSKLRLSQMIQDVLGTVAPPGARVCDLFAGSGTASLALARRWEVVAVDIQEYSRVLCAALLCPPDRSVDLENGLLQAMASAGEGRLGRALLPLLELEENAFAAARQGRFEPICDFVESTSFVAHAHGQNGHDPFIRAAVASARASLKRANLNATPSALMTEQFGGVYFSFRQAIAIDQALAFVARYGGPHRDYLLAICLSVASALTNTVGKHFAQPLRPRDKSGHIKAHLVAKILGDRIVSPTSVAQVFLERYGTLPRNNSAHEARREDFDSFLDTYEGRLDAIYADPPYTRDHYSRFYHVLETMCLGDVPTVSSVTTAGGTKPSRGLYRANRHQSPFCIKSKAPDAFASLFRKCSARRLPLVVSYSPYDPTTRGRPRVLDVPAIIALAKRYYRKVALESAGRFLHNKLNTQRLNTPGHTEAEVMVVCRP